EKREIPIIEFRARRALPLPLAGEGWGGGCSGSTSAAAVARDPLPNRVGGGGSHASHALRGPAAAPPPPPPPSRRRAQAPTKRVPSGWIGSAIAFNRVSGMICPNVRKA